MATLFWDSQGVIHIDYLEKGKTVTGLSYVKILGRTTPNFVKTEPLVEEKCDLTSRATSKLIELAYLYSPVCWFRFGCWFRKEVVHGPEISVDWERQSRHGWLLYRPQGNAFVRRAKEVGASNWAKCIETGIILKNKYLLLQFFFACRLIVLIVLK